MSLNPTTSSHGPAKPVEAEALKPNHSLALKECIIARVACVALAIICVSILVGGIVASLALSVTPFTVIALPCLFASLLLVPFILTLTSTPYLNNLSTTESAINALNESKEIGNKELQNLDISKLKLLSRYGYISANDLAMAEQIKAQDDALRKEIERERLQLQGNRTGLYLNPLPFIQSLEEQRASQGEQWVALIDQLITKLEATKTVSNEGSQAVSA